MRIVKSDFLYNSTKQQVPDDSLARGQVTWQVCTAHVLSEWVDQDQPGNADEELVDKCHPKGLFGTLGC